MQGILMTFIALMTYQFGFYNPEKRLGYSIVPVVPFAVIPGSNAIRTASNLNSLSYVLGIVTPPVSFCNFAIRCVHYFENTQLRRFSCRFSAKAISTHDHGPCR